MGGVIAQAVALAAPRRVLSLAFLCTFARGRDGSKVTLPLLATALRMRIGTRAMRRNAFLSLIMPDRYLRGIDRAELAGQLHPLFGHDLAEQPPIVMKQLSAMSKYDAGARLGRTGALFQPWSSPRAKTGSRSRPAIGHSPTPSPAPPTSSWPIRATASRFTAPRRSTGSCSAISRAPAKRGGAEAPPDVQRSTD